MKTRTIYATPAMEVLEIAVEQGFAATGVDTEGENALWGGDPLMIDYSSEN